MMRRDLRLWFWMFLGPAAWAIDVNVGYAISPPAHAHQSVTPLLVMHAVAVAVIIIAGVGSALEVPTSTERRKLMAVAGVGFSLISLLLVIGNAIPTLVLPSGAEP